MLALYNFTLHFPSPTDIDVSPQLKKAFYEVFIALSYTCTTKIGDKHYVLFGLKFSCEARQVEG